MLQHHDGITATSKTYIEDEFRKRIDKRNEMIVAHLKEIYKLAGDGAHVCELYKSNNVCKFKREWTNGSLSPFKFTIVSFGHPKLEKIELTDLPSDFYLAVEGYKYELFCESQTCRLVFDAALLPGRN